MKGSIEAAFDELAKRWRPLLDVFKDNGQNCCFEVHPGEDIFDGETFEMFLARVNGHEACQIDHQQRAQHLQHPGHRQAAEALQPGGVLRRAETQLALTVCLQPDRRADERRDAGVDDGRRRQRLEGVQALVRGVVRMAFVLRDRSLGTTTMRPELASCTSKLSSMAEGATSALKNS